MPIPPILFTKHAVTATEYKNRFNLISLHAHFRSTGRFQKWLRLDEWFDRHWRRKQKIRGLLKLNCRFRCLNKNDFNRIQLDLAAADWDNDLGEMISTASS